MTLNFNVIQQHLAARSPDWTATLTVCSSKCTPVSDMKTDVNVSHILRGFNCPAYACHMTTLAAALHQGRNLFAMFPSAKNTSRPANQLSRQPSFRASQPDRVSGQQWYTPAGSFWTKSTLCESRAGVENIIWLLVFLRRPRRSL